MEHATQKLQPSIVLIEILRKVISYFTLKMVIGRDLSYKYTRTKVKATKAFVREALKIAKQLGYTDDICTKIANAETESDVIRALITGRHRTKDN